jgi:23S rRNA (uracil1939-C5)-methyltransferase
MVKLLMELLRFDKNMTVLDMYSGVGLFSAFLAPSVKRLVGIEISAEACEDYTTNLDEFDNVELYEAPAEVVLGNVAFNPDVIVMDPPRAGLGSKVVEGIFAQGAATLAYVSCDPSTLARDAKQLTAGGYSLRHLAIIDMFPQTYHIESLSLWGR